MLLHLSSVTRKAHCRLSVGIEMIATYALQNLDPEVAQVACEAIGFNPQNPQHGQFYSDASSKSSALKI